MTTPMADHLSRFVSIAADEDVALFAEFVRVTPITVKRWLDGEQLPVGENLLRAKAFFEAVGCEITEDSRLPRPTRAASRMIGYGILEAPQLQEMLGYKNLSTMYAVLAGNRNPAKSQAYRIERITRESMAELKEAQRKWHEQLSSIESRLRKDIPPSSKDQSVTEPELPIEETESSQPADSDTHRHRERRRRPSEQSEAVAKAFLHLLLSMDYILAGVEDEAALAERIAEQFSETRLWNIRSVVDQALGHKRS